MIYPPSRVSIVGSSGSFFNWMLTTPAMASEPYCEEAPSRSTSIRWMALAGIAFRSIGLDPPCTPDPKRFTRAVLCRRFPLTSTSDWSGLSPRIVNDRNASIPSESVFCGKLTDGAICFKMRPVSKAPESWISSVPYTSTGTARSSAATFRAREPTVTVTPSPCSGATSSWKFAVRVAPAWMLRSRSTDW